MVYSSKNIPKVKIRETSLNDVDIEFNDGLYILYRDGKQESCFSTLSNKEAKELYSSYDLAYGNVLISGLGFGVIALWLAVKPEVKSVKIIEVSQSMVDIFLENNSLPDNVSIEIADIENYKTDNFYDCILLDHYEATSANFRIKSIQSIAKNIPNHNIIWAWSMEDLYLRKCYDTWGLVESNLILNQTDFSEKWNFFKNEIMKIDTLPDLTDEKINEYIYTYVNFLNSKYVLKKDKI